MCRRRYRLFDRVRPMRTKAISVSSSFQILFGTVQHSAFSFSLSLSLSLSFFRFLSFSVFSLSQRIPLLLLLSLYPMASRYFDLDSGLGSSRHPCANPSGKQCRHLLLCAPASRGCPGAAPTKDDAMCRRWCASNMVRETQQTKTKPDQWPFVSMLCLRPCVILLPQSWLHIFAQLSLPTAFLSYPKQPLAPIVQLHPGGTQQLTVASLASREVYHFCGPQDSILTGMCSVNSTSKYGKATRRPTPQAVSKSVTFL